jgi:hypothetical protein
MRHVPSFLAIALAFTLVNCGGAGDTTSPSTSPSNSTPNSGPLQQAQDTVAPRLVDLGVTFAPYDPATGRAGTFDLSLPLTVGPVGPFGRVVSDQNGNPKSLPEFDYFVPAGTVVRAPFDGVVSWIDHQPASDDYEVLVARSKTSPWWFDYDHLSKVLVDSGATVRAGDPVGIVKTIGTQQPIGFVELMVGNYKTETVYCPLALADPARADSLTAVVSRLLADWRSLGHTTPDSAGMVRPGCYVNSARSG